MAAGDQIYSELNCIQRQSFLVFLPACSQTKPEKKTSEGSSPMGGVGGPVETMVIVYHF